MQPNPRTPMSIALAVVRAQMRAELMATQRWLRDEVAELRKELAAARAGCTACAPRKAIPMRP